MSAGVAAARRSAGQARQVVRESCAPGIGPGLPSRIEIKFLPRWPSNGMAATAGPSVTIASVFATPRQAQIKVRSRRVVGRPAAIRAGGRARRKMAGHDTDTSDSTAASRLLAVDLRLQLPLRRRTRPNGSAARMAVTPGKAKGCRAGEAGLATRLACTRFASAKRPADKLRARGGQCADELIDRAAAMRTSVLAQRGLHQLIEHGIAELLHHLVLATSTVPILVDAPRRRCLHLRRT
jgi:hypothetical protein